MIIALKFIFKFKDLIKQATADNIHTIYNPCNPSVPIASANENRFFHRIPALDWKHLEDSARVAVFSGNNYVIRQIGTPASGLPFDPVFPCQPLHLTTPILVTRRCVCMLSRTS